MKFIEQAYKGKNDWWRYFIGFIIIFIFWQIIGSFPFLITGVLHSEDSFEFMNALKDNFTSLTINKNLLLFMMLLTGVFGVFAVKYVVKWVHNRNFLSVITSREKIDIKRFFFGFLIIFILQVLSLLLLFIGDTDELIWNFKPLPFLILVIISFLLFPFQTGAEELIFRGYLMQGFGITTKSKFAALILTSVSFGFLHGANPEVAALGWIVMIFYIGTGLLYGIATLMDEGMELALGMHAANNISASILITASWTIMQTDALFIDTSEPSAGFELYLPVLVIYPIVILIFTKKYGWTNWSEKLFGKVEKPNSHDIFASDQIKD